MINQLVKVSFIDIKTLRNFILDNDISEHDTITLNQINFDNIVLEYRNSYNEGIPIPYYLLSVLIEDDTTGQVRHNTIGVIKNNNYISDDYESFNNEEINSAHSYDDIYRCGWCGNVVDHDGKEFDADTRLFKIKIYETYQSTISLSVINGACCKDRR